MSTSRRQPFKQLCETNRDLESLAIAEKHDLRIFEIPFWAVIFNCRYDTRVRRLFSTVIFDGYFRRLFPTVIFDG